MEELGSMWTYHENIDELKQKVLYTSIELESMKMEANEALKKHKEEVKQLLNLLKIAYQERDEAKDNLQKLLNKLMPTSPVEIQPILHNHNRNRNHNIQNETSPLVLMMPTKPANSSITESNSLSHGSSPVDSFFDAVSSSQDFSNINNMADSGGNICGFVNQQQQHQQQHFDYSSGGGSLMSSSGFFSPSGISKAVVDPEIALIESLVKGKILPNVGKLLQTVMEAGPLLQTLLVAGPLPTWRNPPPLQTFKIPPFSIKICETTTTMRPNPISVAHKSLNSSPSPSPSPSSSTYLPVSRMSSQMCSTSMLNFSNCPSGSAHQINNGLLLPSGSGFNTQISSGGKRQRFQ
ncbi:hypothetical protein Ddye_024929 [Dipteronia dyeriana]|uniref:Uncharacterized protein n=1 Tax=Dipteronia dyeriana TaxID=168575 RepID=A0AAD9TVV5_9ROSI|nr:hypothetical protein Ddye_024929 [Dipteronia dyeriana]